MCDRVQASGVSVLVCDGRAWAFTPTALYIQNEVHSDETPNAICLSSEMADQLATRMSAHEAEKAKTVSDADQNLPEIGVQPLEEARISVTAQNLKIAPPIPFDVARQVRVFEPYIQYVEVSLHGCAIQRRRINIPAHIVNLTTESDIASRIRTTFDLIESDSEASSKPLEGKLTKILNIYTRSLGKPWGRILLRAKRKEFDEKIDDFGKKLEEHKKKVRQKLDEHITKSLDQVVAYYLPIITENPPDRLIGQITPPKPTEDLARAWLKSELKGVFPEAEDLVSGMALNVQFRDVTYETLQQEDFGNALRQAYPHVSWDKPFNEFNAEQEKN